MPHSEANQHVGMHGVLPEEDKLGIGLIPPPRNTSKAHLPHVCQLKRSQVGRVNMFIENTHYEDMRCSGSITQHVQRHSLFHSHSQNNRRPEEYSKTTGILCWHCCHAFDGHCVPIPREYNASDGTYIVYGCFCSLSCAKAHLLETGTFNSAYQMLLLSKMARHVYGESEVIAAPPRLSLDVFGGPFSLQRFRCMKNVCMIHEPPFVSSYMVVEERQSVYDESASGCSQDGSGSVRGLRRVQTPRPRESPQISKSSMYDAFVHQKVAVTNDCASVKSVIEDKDIECHSNNTADKKTDPGQSGGLARFLKEKA